MRSPIGIEHHEENEELQWGKPRSWRESWREGRGTRMPAWALKIVTGAVVLGSLAAGTAFMCP